jgi:hypothetical protein
MLSLRRVIIILFSVLILPINAIAWSCKAHTFIAQEAGLMNPEAACFPDLSKKEEESLLGAFHWHDAAPDTVVTTDYIDQYQITEGMYVKANSPESKPIKVRVPDPAGVLYWKILELYQHMKGKEGWEYEYYLTNIAHYIGDLSQPLHNFPYGDAPASNGRSYHEIGQWAKEHHTEFDDVLDTVLPLKGKEKEDLESKIRTLQIRSTDDLKRAIAKIANSSIALANKCFLDKRNITKDEALKQIAESVSLLRAVIKDTKK